MDVCVPFWQMKDTGHLAGGFSPRTGIGHGKGGINGERGHNKIPRLFGQIFIQIEGERIVCLDDFVGR